MEAAKADKAVRWPPRDAHPPIPHPPPLPPRLWSLSRGHLPRIHPAPRPPPRPEPARALTRRLQLRAKMTLSVDSVVDKIHGAGPAS